MAFWNRATETPTAPATVPAHEIDTLRYELERAEESIRDLQMENRGWMALTQTGEALANREELGRNADTVRAGAILNPLMRRGRSVRIGYVWGQGVAINAAEPAEDAKAQDVDTIVQGYLTDERNHVACFGAEARQAAEGDLFDDGNHFRAHFVDPMSGHVQVRPLPFNEVVDIRTAPGDRYTPHYYLRRWTEAGNGLAAQQRAAYYPDIRFQPATRVKAIDGIPVMWPGEVGGAAIQHVKANPVGRERMWGIGDGFTALPFAQGYKGFLDDWLTLVKVLSKLAFQLKDPNGKSQQMRAVANQLNSMGGIGGTAATGSGTIEAIPKSGATIDADSGRPVAAMVAAALDLPVTMLLADPGVSGARAVAETLDRPMRLAIQARQELWAEADRVSIQFVIEQHVIAPRGHLKGVQVRDQDRVKVRFTDDTDPTINVKYPALEDVDTKTFMEAVEVADGLDVLPPIEKARIVFRTLGLDNVAALIDSMTEDGVFQPPSLTEKNAAGKVAAQRFRDGTDVDGNKLE